jgi:hypothetical protein
MWNNSPADIVWGKDDLTGSCSILPTPQPHDIERRDGGTEEECMETPFYRIISPLLLAALLCACVLQATPLPTETPIPATATRTATATSTSTATPLPPTPTDTPAPTDTPITAPRKPSSTPGPTKVLVPVNTLEVSPTPVPGWKTFTNEYLGYSLNIPSDATIYQNGATGMDANEQIPPDFSGDEYFHYVLEILPESLCLSLHIPGASITISPPYKPYGSYMGPCPGLGVGSGYRFESASETWWMAGKNYDDVQGTRLVLESSGAFDAEFHVFELENGFRAIFYGDPPEGMSYETYLQQKSAAREMLATLNWFRLPEMTKPGTTCAGKFTRLVPWVHAVVIGDKAAGLRSAPTLGENYFARLEPGTVLKVLEGPVCADGLIFWKIRNEAVPGQSGWIAEGNREEFWLDRVRDQE